MIITWVWEGLLYHFVFEYFSLIFKAYFEIRQAKFGLVILYLHKITKASYCKSSRVLLSQQKEEKLTTLQLLSERA